MLRADTNVSSLQGLSKIPFPERSKTKYRNLVAELPENNVVTELTENFLSELSWFFLLIERHYFKEALKEWYSASEHVSKGELYLLRDDSLQFPGLLFQLLAVTLQFLPPNTKSSVSLGLDQPADCEKLSQKYSHLGLLVIELVGKNNPTLTSIQHDLMRGLWLKNCSQGTEAWRILGNAVRYFTKPPSSEPANT